MMLGMLKVINQEQLLQAQSASVIHMSNLTIQDVNTD
jgi:predicted XRE-type DNA-binding protein